ncbi:peptidoglycan recognition protein family protein [Streptomyces aidingensis]|uniref:N-acetylmuramoyl-L-alanine amidase n=1 Tax=Streptomyces aidingensis TaxID=910347 RepID=A0A1I1GYS6_9ACTN|nr:N-acetylmuramoyl-L-alanine amidase [Streptomyces aidingensis]SFC15028.1 N-acetylmuramoyl-L-alanine amidase [Streptomyces aidingensis]
MSRHRGKTRITPRIWGTGLAVAVAAAGTIVVQEASGVPDRPRAPEVLQGEVHAETFHEKLRVKDGGKRAEVPRTDTERFSMLGVTWTDPADEPQGTVEVRTRSALDGEWSGWQELEPAPQMETREDDAGRGATEPLWAGPSDGVEARVVTASGETSGLPEGLRLDLVNPSVEEGEGTGGQAAGEVRTLDAVPAAYSTSGAPQPAITTRAEWGADEDAVTEPVQYLPGGEVKAAVVHHTAGENDYTCMGATPTENDSAAVVRGIMAYHMQSQDYRDIGYNFLVDKCGRIFEGRKGGVDMPVFGAHTYGFNSETTGIAVLGDYTAVAGTTPVLTAVAGVAAYKLGQYDADPRGSVELTPGAAGTNYFGESWETGETRVMPRIFGHRDGYNTECPGNRLYDQLSSIRIYAGGPPAGLKLTGVSGTTDIGSVPHTRSGVTVEWSTRTPSALLAGFEVLVDGEPAATLPGTARSAEVALAHGAHQISVRGTHLSGRSKTTGSQQVVADSVAPVFTKTPRLNLRAGTTVEADAVPVTMYWGATDETALDYAKLWGPFPKTFPHGATSGSVEGTTPAGVTTDWRMRAYDMVGNSTLGNEVYTPLINQESSAAASGDWNGVSRSGYLGGGTYQSRTEGSRLTWEVTARSVGLVVSRAGHTGQVRVFVDGSLVKTVDTRSSDIAHRQMVFAMSYPTTEERTVTVEVVGTSGRPTVVVDGLISVG